MIGALPDRGQTIRVVLRMVPAFSGCWHVANVILPGGENESGYWVVPNRTGAA